MSTNLAAALLASASALTIIFAFTLMFAAAEHQIHPDCASVLDCVRL
jgi:hypothetical protein